MFPVALDLTRVPILLTGQGELLLRRLAYLDEAKAKHVAVFCESPSDLLREAAGERLIQRRPSDINLRDYTVIMIAGLERSDAARLVASARSLGKLVNVEDINDLCDFYFTANVRRGDLIIAISTSGASPTLARKIRDFIAALFGEEWSVRVREIKEMRLALKARGASMKEIVDGTEKHLTEKGWLPEQKDAA